MDVSMQHCHCRPLLACPFLHICLTLLFSAWLDTWRKHLHAALSKKLVLPTQLPPVPEPLPQAVRSLLCKCHPECPLLAVPLPGLVNKRGR